AAILRVDLTPIIARDTGEMERDLTAFARERNGGLIVSSGAVQQIQRDTIIAATAQHQLPAVYPFRGFVVQGGLISYGIDQTEPYRLAAGYVHPILRGEKPAELPVQQPTKFDLVINLKTAKALGLFVAARSVANGTSETSQRDPVKSASRVRAVMRRTSSEDRS